jgi:hypothetical protein
VKTITPKSADNIVVRRSKRHHKHTPQSSKVFPIKSENVPFRVTKHSTVQLLTETDFEIERRKTKGNLVLTTGRKMQTYTEMSQNTQDNVITPNKDKMTNEELYSPWSNTEDIDSVLDSYSKDHKNTHTTDIATIIPTTKIHEIQTESIINTMTLEGTIEQNKPMTLTPLPPIGSIFNLDFPVGDINTAPVRNPNIATLVTTTEHIQNKTPLTELKTVSSHKIETNEREHKIKTKKMEQQSIDTKHTITDHAQQDKHSGLQYEQIQDIIRQTLHELTPIILETVRSTIHEAVQYEVKQAIRKHQSTDYNP